MTISSFHVVTFDQWAKKEGLDVPERGIAAVLELAGEGATVPFMARYRKERTGNLDEVQIQKVLDVKASWDELLSRKEFIWGEIERQGKLTDSLKALIQTNLDRTALEDIYLPYKQKRKTKATLAKEAGLEPLADWLWKVGGGEITPEPGQTPELWAFTFKNEPLGFNDGPQALQGAVDILVERLSENRDLRQSVRETFFDRAYLKSQKAEKAKKDSKFEMYFDFSERLQSLLQKKNSHRYLAIRRGWIEEELSIQFCQESKENLDELFVGDFLKAANAHHDSSTKSFLEKAAKTALKVHVLPSIENEGHKALKDNADEAAIAVFSENVRKVLLSSPFGPRSVLGIDPGIRTGCKIALIDDSGKFLKDAVVYLQTEDQKQQAKQLLTALVQSGVVQAIAVGNGTAGRETERFVREILKELNSDILIALVAETGASVYSASSAAREEFPELDVTVRGAISIARRFQDPLAELVKIDPKSVGVGQYQHDVSQTALKRALELVVDICVNSVGVNVNTASPYLLARVSGIGEALARSVIQYRNDHGIFKSREDLKKVPRFSEKTFELAAGFLRIPESENVLDHTGVHPEKYGVLGDLAQVAQKDIRSFVGSGARDIKRIPGAKEKLGEFTLDDIIRELEKPGRDPRKTFERVKFREDIAELKDVKPGMSCEGVVTNVTNFGAFVDIGVKQDGLVHISQFPRRVTTDPSEVLSPGDRVTIRVLEVNLEKSQMAFTMRPETGTRTASALAGKAHAGRHRAPEPKPLHVSYAGAATEQQKSGEPQKAASPAPSRFTPSAQPRIKPAPAGGSDSYSQGKSAYGGRSGGPGGGIRPGFSPKPATPAQPFNNAFAGLAALKSGVKK